jgi:N-acetylglucosaminyldiphosphoundecaprenol N-acetyl-beta-D-mannosaminyltransferase
MQNQAAIARREDPAPKTVFGFSISPYNLNEVVEIITHSRRTPEQGVGLIVTPNIDHVVKLNTDPALVEAYQSAAMITCDGAPLYHFARMRGLSLPGRVAGSDITQRLMREVDLPAWHRLFFVADSQESVAGLRRWAEARGVALDRLGFAVPPYGFEKDDDFCDRMAADIRRHGTTILLMGVGAPKSEVFVHSRRDRLPPCWALCVGQSIRIEAGLMKRAPALWQKLNVEWLWRITREPKRMTKRYTTAGFGFLYLALRESLGL